jgi:hypothetical protein
MTEFSNPTAYGISAKLQLEPRLDPLPALHALLELPLRLEEGGGYRAFIALDEFQDIDKVQDLDGLIRSHIQFQGEVASYVFAGSEPGLMKQLFEIKERPLYGSAVPMRLQRLRNEDIAAYVAERFAQSERNVGEALNPLLDAAKGHSPAGDAARPPSSNSSTANTSSSTRSLPNGSNASTRAAPTSRQRRDHGGHARLGQLASTDAFALSSGVTMFALVLSEGPLAIDLFASSRDAATAFAQVLRDEPSFGELLEIRELAADTALDCSDRCSLN